MLHFMDSAEFCGTACHSVMSPEWTTYQASPHARVACVECHVGEGVGALVNSKLNGAWQMVSAAFDLYERPIPTPVHQLRPARETCEKCHWPNKFYGSRLQTRVSLRKRRGLDAALHHAQPQDRRRRRRQHRCPLAHQPRQRGSLCLGRRRTRGDGLGRVPPTRRVCPTIRQHAPRRHQRCGRRCPDHGLRRLPQPRHPHLPGTRPGGGREDPPRRHRPQPAVHPTRALAAIRGGYPSLEAAKSGIRAGLESFYRRNYPDQASGLVRPDRRRRSSSSRASGRATSTPG